MINNFELFLALKYLRSKRNEGFISIISTFSLIGISLGVATLIIVMSVMNGFRSELIDRIVGVNGHSLVYLNQNKHAQEDINSLVEDIASVDPKFLSETLTKLDIRNADALFISCTALPALEILDEVEKKIGKIVLSSNQTLIWDTLRSVGYKSSVQGYGKLLRN